MGLPPPGVRPNFFSPESRAYQLQIAAIVYLVLIVLFVGVRLYVKRCIVHSFSRDDCEETPFEVRFLADF